MKAEQASATARSINEGIDRLPSFLGPLSPSSRSFFGGGLGFGLGFSGQAGQRNDDGQQMSKLHAFGLVSFVRAAIVGALRAASTALSG